MKRILLALALLILASLPASAAGCTGTGNCYWEGGSGNSSDTTKWCTTDTNPCTGTTGGAPTSADNCNFTANSNTTAYTVTTDATLSCKDFTTALPSGSGVPSITASSFSIAVFGNLNLVAGTLVTGGSGFVFSATATGKTITTNSVTMGAVAFNGTGGGWTLQDDLTLISSRTLTVTNGTLDTNAKTVSAGFFVSTSGTRTLTFTNSTFNITGVSGTPWNVSAIGTLTGSLAGSTINLNGGASGVALIATFGGSAALGYDTVNITGAGLWASNNTTTIKNFSYTSTTNKTDTISIVGMTIAASGSLALAGNSTVNRAFVFSPTLGTISTITVPSTATVTLTNVDFRDITAAGSYGTWTGTSLGDCLGNSGITFDGSTTQTWTGIGGQWSAGGAAWTSRVPLPQDDVVIGAGFSAGTIGADMPRLGRNINFSGMATGVSFNFAWTPNTIYGNITLPTAAPTITGINGLTLAGRGSHTITSNGKTFTQAVTVAAFGGTYTLQDAFNTASFLTMNNGTLDSGSYNATFLAFSGSSATHEVKATEASTWYATRTTASPWAAASQLIVTNFFATINYSAATPSDFTFAGSGKTYRNFVWSSTTVAAGTRLTFTGSNTFRDIKIDGTTARQVTFTSGTTQTVDTFTKVNTTPGVLTTINSSTPGTRATLQSRGPQQNLRFLSIIDINAVGGAGWFAGNRSTNGGNNYGWRFYPPGDIMTIMKQRRSSNDNFPAMTKAA